MRDNCVCTILYILDMADAPLRDTTIVFKSIFVLEFCIQCLLMYNVFPDIINRKIQRNFTIYLISDFKSRSYFELGFWMERGRAGMG